MIKSGHFRAIFLFSHRLYPAHIWSSIHVDGALLFPNALFTFTISLKSLSALILVHCVNTRLAGCDGAHVFVVALAMWPDLNSASVPLLYREDLLIVD